jgi:hypothetical protein
MGRHGANIECCRISDAGHCLRRLDCIIIGIPQTLGVEVSSGIIYYMGTKS